MVADRTRLSKFSDWLFLAASLGLALALSVTETVQLAEWKSLDWRTEFRTDLQTPPDPRLALVLFDDQTEAILEKPWPVDRQYHAQLTQVLALAGARVVAWDVILDASREGEGDAAMGQIAEAAHEAGTEVISAAVTNADAPELQGELDGPTRALSNVEGDISRVIGDARAFVPFPELRRVSAYGFADTPPGAGGLRREIPLIVRVGKEVFPGLSLQTVMSYWKISPEAVRVKLGDAIYFTAEGRERRVPIDEAGRLLMNYRYDLAQHPTDFAVFNYGSLLFGLSEVFLEERTPTVPPPDMKGKIVIVGQTVTGKADIGPSALSKLSPLSFVIANAVNNVLREDYARRVPPWLVWGGVGLLGVLAVWIGRSLSVWVVCGGTLLIVVGYSSVAVWLWVWKSYWLPWVAPLFGLGLLQFTTIGRRIWREQKARQEIKGMFGNYVSPHVVDQLLRAGTPPKLGGHTEEITAYFSDIQGFSSFSELLPPERLVELMNEYLTACTDIIQEEGGTLDKYIGDAVVAMFGAPVPLPDHAYRACVTSQRIQRKMAELREKWGQESDRWPEAIASMETRIGLNSGRCVIGNMGSRSRFNYTMMGDDVNLAARMESGAKIWGVKTLCTEATKLACEMHGGDRIAFRALGRIVVKGRAQPVPIFEIMGLREWLAPETFRCAEVFSEGLECFYRRDWANALIAFKQSQQHEIVKNERAKTPSLFYINLVESYIKNSPPEGWDGVVVMSEK